MMVSSMNLARAGRFIVACATVVVLVVFLPSWQHLLHHNVVKVGGLKQLNGSETNHVSALKNSMNSTEVESSLQHLQTDPPLATPHCQVIYVIGVEGSDHHGASDVIQNFAQRQVDSNGQNFVVHFRNETFRSAVDWYNGGVPKTKPTQVRKNVMDQLCPPNDGRRHVIIEDESFPSGMRYRRQAYVNMTAREIASLNVEHPHPVDLEAFAGAFAPFADVRFIVLHRPFINTIVSHYTWDHGAAGHSTVIRGNILYLAELLARSGDKRMIGHAPWMLLCVDRFKNSYNSKKNGTMITPREKILADMSQFLQWKQPDCPSCFNKWRDSKKDPEQTIGHDAFEMLEKDRETLRGIWPPTVMGNGTMQERECPL